MCHHWWSLIPCAIIDDLRFHMWSWWSLIPYVMIYDSIRNHWRSLIPYVIDSISDHPWSLIPHAIINVLFCMRSECMYNRWDLKYNVHHNLKLQHSGQLSNSDFQTIFWPNIPLSLALVKLQTSVLQKAKINHDNEHSQKFSSTSSAYHSQRFWCTTLITPWPP